jgi:hypothetical protein
MFKYNVKYEQNKVESGKVIQALPKAGATRTSEIREEFEETKE